MPRDVSLSDSKCWNGGHEYVNRAWILKTTLSLLGNLTPYGIFCHFLLFGAWFHICHFYFFHYYLQLTVAKNYIYIVYILNDVYTAKYLRCVYIET